MQYVVSKRLLAGRYFESVGEFRGAIAQNEMKPVEINGCVTWRRGALTVAHAPPRNVV